MISFKKIVIGTKNPAKKVRYKRAFTGYVDSIFGLDEFSITQRPEETGNTAERNAEIKAKFYAAITGLPVFSEDEALNVDFLPEKLQPGVFVRRINGKEVSDDELLAYWENILFKIPQEKRTGRWQVAYCIATPDGKTSVRSVKHPIMFFTPPSPIRIPGWPLSSIQGPSEFGKPHSELTGKERKKRENKRNVVITEIVKSLLLDSNRVGI